MRVEVKFIGRKIGAIGIGYEIKEMLDVSEGATLDELRLKLYENYEHISLDKRDVFIENTNDRYFLDT